MKKVFRKNLADFHLTSKMKKRGKEKGVSPVIATVLLVGLVVVMGVIIFLWAKSFVKEEATKFNKNIRLSCEDVQFDASYSTSDEQLEVLNTGIVPIFRLNIKVYKPGGFETTDISELASNWPSTGLKQGEPFSGDIGDISGATKIVAIPVLIGSSGQGQKTFTCGEEYGQEAL